MSYSTVPCLRRVWFGMKPSHPIRPWDGMHRFWYPRAALLLSLSAMPLGRTRIIFHMYTPSVTEPDVTFVLDSLVLYHQALVLLCLVLYCLVVCHLLVLGISVLEIWQRSPLELRHHFFQSCGLLEVFYYFGVGLSLQATEGSQGNKCDAGGGGTCRWEVLVVFMVSLCLCAHRLMSCRVVHSTFLVRMLHDD